MSKNQALEALGKVTPKNVMAAFGGSEITLLVASLVMVGLIMLNPGELIEPTAYLENGAVDQFMGLLKIVLPGYFIGRPLSHGLKGYQANAEAQAEERTRITRG